jgi:hypothetical protein
MYFIDKRRCILFLTDLDGLHKQRGQYRELNLSVLSSGEPSRIRLSDGGSLLIDGATRDDTGYYLCQAGNGVGSDLSKVVYLTVHSK